MIFPRIKKMWVRDGVTFLLIGIIPALVALWYFVRAVNSGVIFHSIDPSFVLYPVLKLSFTMWGGGSFQESILFLIVTFVLTPLWTPLVLIPLSPLIGMILFSFLDDSTAIYLFLFLFIPLALISYFMFGVIAGKLVRGESATRNVIVAIITGVLISLFAGALPSSGGAFDFLRITIFLPVLFLQDVFYLNEVWIFWTSVVLYSVLVMILLNILKKLKGNKSLKDR